MQCKRAQINPIITFLLLLRNKLKRYNYYYNCHPMITKVLKLILIDQPYNNQQVVHRIFIPFTPKAIIGRAFLR